MFRTVLRWLFLPLRWLARLRGAVRRGLSPGAVTIGLAALGCGNVIWGYPLIGFLSAFLALLLVAFVINRLFAPRLRIAIDAPSLTSVDQPVPLRVMLANGGRLPAFELLTDLESTSQRCVIETLAESTPGMPLEGHRVIPFEIRYLRRGLRRLPMVRVTSRFPLGLFNASQSFRDPQQIAVAPARLHQVPSHLHDWLEQLRADASSGGRAGDSYHYLGSREYQPATAVRRWDFASWARLGRPIVREFEQPQSHSFMLVIDTFRRTPSGAPRAVREREGEQFEHLLRAAVTVMESAAKLGLTVRLLTADPPRDCQKTAAGQGRRIDGLLMRLAGTYPVDEAKQADWLIDWPTSLTAGDRFLLLQTDLASSTVAGQQLAAELRRRCSGIDVLTVSPSNGTSAPGTSDRAMPLPTTPLAEARG